MAEAVGQLCFGLDAAMHPVRQVSVKSSCNVERVFHFAFWDGRFCLVREVYLMM